jgi:CRISPR-associated endonuclease Cas2
MIVIAYDIRDEKRLRKIAKLMQSYAIRIQLSVFLLPKATKNDVLNIVKESKKYLKDEDDIRIYKAKVLYDWNNELKGLIV